MRQLRKFIQCCLLVFLALPAALPANSTLENLPITTDGRFSGFDAQQYVRQVHPALADQAEAISHWAGYYRVNPILLSHLLATPSPPDQT